MSGAQKRERYQGMRSGLKYAANLLEYHATQQPSQAEALREIACRLRMLYTPEQVAETGWLIESSTQIGPYWWTGNSWQPDSLLALRFARKQDAQSVIDSTPLPGAFPSEHSWYGPRSQDRRIREYLAFSHTDSKCMVYADDGELQCANISRHGRTIDFRREPIGDLLDIIIGTRMKEYAASQETGGAK